MNNTNFRPSAVPLVTVDPYFSLWSFATNLTDDSTRHWTGRRMAMTGMIRYDGETMMFMGKFTGSDRNYNERVPALPQTGCTVTPTSSIYTFENDLLSMKLIFTTPILLDLFHFIEANQEMCRVLLSPHGDMNFLHRLNQVVREKCLQMWPNEEDKKDATFEYHYSFVVYGCVGVFRTWLNSKCQEPAEKMADMADAMIRRGSLS